jgi:MFS superfamily sulfate permease-like transporter
MPLLEPSLETSAGVCLALVAVALLTRGRGGRLGTMQSFAVEFAVVMALLGTWQFVGRFVRGETTIAIHRAENVVAVQRFLHLPDEVALQGLLLPHPLLVQAANAYYAYAHLNGMAAFLLWMWWRHRPYYPSARITVVASTLICLLIQFVPVAPPRLLPALGYVDTALRYGQSVYGTYTGGLSNQLSAMPSVHVAWAVIVGWYVVRASRSRWRWLGPAHAVITVLVVTVTANHWWLDGIVAALIVAGVLAGQEVVDAIRARDGGTARERPEPATTLEPTS